MWGVPRKANGKHSICHLFARNVAKAFAPPREARSKYSQSYYCALASSFAYNDWPHYNQFISTHNIVVAPKTTVERFPSMLQNDPNRMPTVYDIILHFAKCGVKSIPAPVHQAMALFGRQWLADYNATTAARPGQAGPQAPTPGEPAGPVGEQDVAMGENQPVGDNGVNPMVAANAIDPTA